MVMAATVKVGLGSVGFVVFWVLAVFPAVPFMPIGRTAGSLLGAMLMVVFGVITPDQAYAAIDLPILGLLFGTMVVSVYLERADMFKYLGKLLAWKSQGAKDLLCRICLISAVSSAFFTNDTSCVVLTEFVLKIARQQNLPPHPFLLALASSANIGSSVTPIGNPQNLVIAVQSKISFGKFLFGIFPAMLVGVTVNALLLLCMYWKLLSVQKDVEDAAAELVPEEEVVSHRFSPATLSHLTSLNSQELNNSLGVNGHANHAETLRNRGVTAPKANWRCSPAISFYSDSTKLYNRSSIRFYAGNRNSSRIRCNLKATGSSNNQPETSTGIQLYRDIERLLTETVKQSQDWGSSQDWDEIEGAWVLQPKTSKPKLVVHVIGGVFVGAAPQLSYRLFLERLRQKDVLVIATPYASGFDHFYIADEVQFKFDRCLRFLQERVQDLPVFGIGHSLGSVIHLLIGARYAVKRNGNVLMAFNNKDASLAVPLFSSVLVPMMQNLGPVLSQIASSPTIRLGAEMTMKQIENLSPSIMKQVFPLVEQLTPLYTDLINGKENFTPRPEETQRLIRSYYGISRNLLVKFKDDTIDETSTLAQVLSSGSAISSMLDMSIRTLPGDHALPLQQALPNAPPGMTDAVNRSSELLANLTAGTPWENVTKEVGNTLGNVDSIILNSGNSKDLDMLVETITSWMYSNTGPKLLQ